MKKLIFSLCVLTGISLFSQDPKKVMPPYGYNAPVNTGNRNWDLYGEGSFNYWKAYQDNLELGSRAVIGATISIGGSSALASVDQKSIDLKFRYHAGFQVALGSHLGSDHWDMRLNYIWFHSKSSVHASVVGTSPAEVIFPMQDPFEEAILVLLADGIFYKTASESWKLRMDLADLELARAEYVGKSLIFRPFVALRGALITQNLQANYAFQDAALLSSEVTTKSRSWGVGPRIGLKTDWLLKGNFRVLASAAGDILHTCYTKLRHTAVSEGSHLLSEVGILRLSTDFQDDHVTANRAHVDLDLGLGWGGSFAKDKCQIDFRATYGFQAFFSQNMFRHFEDDVVSALSISPNGNLYIEGVSAMLRLDF